LIFLRRFNELAHQVPGAITAAEESTAFPGVSRPTYLGGLGFTMKWNMGWMHDMLDYFAKEAVHRKYHQNDITFSMLYAFTENFVLPISHDEIVHGKRALLDKDARRRLAEIRERARVSRLHVRHPGKKLLFMGSEIVSGTNGMTRAACPGSSCTSISTANCKTFVAELNRLYRTHPAYYEVDFHWEGFEWVDFRDVDGSTISFIRRPQNRRPFLLFVCNFTPVPRFNYRVGVPIRAFITRSSTPMRKCSAAATSAMAGASPPSRSPITNHYHSVSITLPPLAVVVFESPG